MLKTDEKTVKSVLDFGADGNEYYAKNKSSIITINNFKELFINKTDN